MLQRQKVRIHLIKLKDRIQMPLWESVWSDNLNFLWYETKNWGDALNPVLIKLLSGKKARGFDINVYCDSDSNQTEFFSNQVKYLVVGSTLQHVDEQTIVWGAGFTSEHNKFKRHPKEVLAVRGPMSAYLVRKQGIDCSDNYGDPALLLPSFYQAKSQTKKFKLGIIPHYLDFKDPILKKFRENSNVLLINVKTGIENFVDEISSCERIVSSSLHGLIAADAYKIPSKWISISDRIPGGKFKFNDYYASQGIEESPIYLLPETSYENLVNECRLRSNKVDLDKLLSCCPFLA